ncbi:MAG: aminotransferase class IV [Bdellovibrionales bacterium]
MRPSDVLYLCRTGYPRRRILWRRGKTLSKAIISENYDRAAPLGTGGVKAAGNYAADLLPTKIAKSNGFSMVLYLDSKTRTRIEEFGTSNFIAIDSKGKYVTPKSSTILPSITNKSLLQLAPTLGVEAAQKEIQLEEIRNFKEIGAAMETALGSLPLMKFIIAMKSSGQHKAMATRY